MMLPPGVPELVDLDLLLCVERLGSLSKAARAHSVSQPTASVRIQAVERRLGLRLLERSPTGCRLTPAGQLVTQWARGVVDAAAELATRTAALRDVREGRLRVAASLTVADHLMPHWLIALREEAPHVSVELLVQNSRRVIEQLLSGSIDIGFIEDPCSHADLAHTVIGQDELVVVVAPAHPWARRPTPVTPAELLAGPLVLREPGSGTRETLERALGGLKADSPHLELGSTNAIKATVAAGTGAAVLSAMTVDDELSHGELVRVPVIGVHLIRQLRAVWGTHAELSSPARSLIKIAGCHTPQAAPRKNGRVRSRAVPPGMPGHGRIPAPMAMCRKYQAAAAG